MAFIDGTVVNVALPFLQARLNATALDVQWVVESYALFLSALLLIGGSLGDQYGRRRIFIIGIVLFAAASGACGLASDIRQLIVARAFQGLGAALLVPGSLAIIGNSFSDQDRGRAIGTWSGFSAITAAIGPLLGGWLIEHISWRAVFFINLPIALVVILIALRCVPESADEERTRVDLPGAVFATLGLGALVYGLIESSRVGFRHAEILGMLGSGAVLLGIFLVVEARRADPMLPLTLFRSRTFAGTNLLTFFLYASLGGTLFFVPLNLIQVQHYSATQAGAALLPFILAMSLLSRWSGGLVAKYNPKIPLVIGPIVAAAGYALLMVPGIGGHYWTTFLPVILVLGLGMTISVAPLTTTVMNSVPSHRAGVASGVNNAVARTAGLLAIAVLGIVMLNVFDRELERESARRGLPDSVVRSLQSQHTKLAAIPLPLNQEPGVQQATRETIDQSFVAGFRTISAIGAFLALAGAAAAGLLVDGTSKN
jgi:EmrB/QacA subfamily drug resistance transporter